MIEKEPRPAALLPEEKHAAGQAPAAEEWHALAADEVAARLETDPELGLADREVAARLGRFGPNKLVAERRVTLLAVAREELAEPMILLLLLVGIVYSVWGEVGDAIAIFAIIAAIVCIEVFNEYRAKAAVASLSRLSVPTAPTIRGGTLGQVATEALVPGDLVLLRPGDRVPADLRLSEASALHIDESSLTGESVPVGKTTRPVPAATELADRANMAYASTLVVGGKGKGVVVATGMSTEQGRIVGLVREAREPRTPLQTAMRDLSTWLVWVALGFSVLIPVLGYLFGQPIRDMILTGLTLAFATIPEEMPILITVVLGLGALRLSREKAIVKRLRAAETLGGVTTVATDKTGTLTENRMALHRAYFDGAFFGGEEIPSSAVGRRLLEVGVLASDASAVALGDGPEGTALGDPTDLAFVRAAEAAALEPAYLRGDGPVAEFPFDEGLRTATSAYRSGEGLLVVTKGAAEAVFERCRWQLTAQGVAPLDDRASKQALAAAEVLATQGLRVLGLAFKTLEGLEAGRGLGREKAEADLILAGFVGLLDPPRPEVPSALSALRSAGIKVLMLTGDHPATARAIARDIGLDEREWLTGQQIDDLSEGDLAQATEKVSLYARIAPQHKLRIVQALQSRGEVVAVTGDGVNDAPALKQAAIGVAMGETGTDAAREAAGIVLVDDNFATIALAVREGRVLFANLRKAVRYYLSVKLALVGASLVAVLAQLPVPFAPIQIIVMELFMDLGASLAFTSEPPEGDVMDHPPRDPRRPFMDAAMRLGILAGGLTLGLETTAVYLWGWWQGGDVREAQTLAFAVWIVGHLALAMYMRSERQPLIGIGLLSNRAYLAWVAVALGLLVAAVYVPVLRETLRTAELSLGQWGVVVAVALITPVWMEILKLRAWRRAKAS
ncbi:MAG: cation-translocating P-type ATPase [Chloroflexota bacterium]